MEKLNKEQFEAVTHKDGPLLIIAGAGTGKTSVITQKISWLIEQGHAGTQEILALTFTEKAAGEMEERVDRLLPMGYLDLWISTFHSFCERILREEGLEIGLPADFKLLNGTEAWMLVKKNLDKFNLDYYKPLGNPTKFIHALLGHFSRAKDEVIDPGEYLEYAEKLKLDTDRAESGIGENELEQDIVKTKEIAESYHVYQKLLLDNNYLDFGDLINYTLRLFKERPAILNKYRKQFKFVLVDEFQDTNWAQYELIKMIAEPRNNLTVVGDDDQSIFRFRGASMSNILQFKKDYPESKNIVLINNYRNTQNILDLSYNFIAQNNPNRLEAQLKKEKDNLNKKLKADRGGDGLIECINAESLDAEVEKVLNRMAELKARDKEATWNDFAILIRANDMANNFIPALEREELPYVFLASRGLYARPVIMNIISYLKLLDDYHEGAAMYRILSNPVFNFSRQEISEINYWSAKKTLSLYETLKTAAAFGFKKEAVEKINKILFLIDKHTELARHKGAAEVALNFLNDSGYLKYLTEKSEQEVRDNTSLLNQFYKRIQEFERNNDDKSARNFLKELEMEIESGDQGSLMPDFESGPEAIKILTVHASKGLEFKYVFVVNLVDKRFPTIPRKEPIALPEELIKEILPEGDAHLEEERRLFYVAMTRAREGLFFSWGEDYGGVRKKKPSLFLMETGLVSGEKEKKVGNNSLKIQDKKIEPADVEYKMPAAFSFSQIAAFENCPKQYYYNFILKIPVRGKAQFSFGKSMHGSLQRIMELILSKQKNIQSDLFSGDDNKNIKKKMGELISQKEVREIYEASWIPDWFDSKKERDDYYKKGMEALEDFYGKYKDDYLSVAFIEKGFKFKVAAGEVYSFKGVIDRIDDLGDGYKILDYKTGKPKDKLTFDDKKQLLIYQLAAAELFDKPIKSLSFYYLDDNSEREFLGTNKELEKVEQFLGDTIGEIKKGKFNAKPGILCKYCDFNNICEDRQG